MNPEQQDILRAKVNLETSLIAWKELQRFFATGAAIHVSSRLDLVEVAFQLHLDNKRQFESWLGTGMIGKVTDDQAAAWIDNDSEVWAVVVSPWVLIQEVRTVAEQ